MRVYSVGSVLVALAHAEAESAAGNTAALALVKPRFSLPPDADDEVDNTLGFESECMTIWSLRWRSVTRGEGARWFLGQNNGDGRC